ncbi:MAG: ABC transporter permease [Ekhidna sp.]
MNNQPPQFFLRFFRWFCHPELQRPIEGDLMELYDERVEELGKRKADRKFKKDVLLLFRKDIIKPASGTYRLTNYGMIKNYFKVTVRNLFRQKLYSAINIGGLSIGIASFLLIFIYVQYERSFDDCYSNADNIYNIYQQQPGNFSLGTDFFAVTPAALAPTLVAEYPEIESATTMDAYSTLIESEGEHHFEPIVVADERFFEVFKHTFIAGNPKTAMNTAEGTVLTESFAKKLFKNEDPIGKEIKFWAGSAFVTGVIKDLPKNSSIKFSAILSIQASEYYRSERIKEQWDGNSYFTFLTFKEGANPPSFESKLKELLAVRWQHTDIPNKYFVQPLSEFHLRGSINEDFGVKGNAKQLSLFSVIAILILTLAAINYMNLAVARSINRAKEVGLRKAIGARKTQLVIQFLGESVFLSLLALFIALGITQLTLPLFGQLVERQMEIGLLSDLNLIPFLFITVVMLGIISGSYPALFMSSLRPVHVLKGRLGTQKSGGKLQKFLIVSQYSISIIMLISTLIAYQQIRFISEKELGIEKDQIVIVRVRGREMRENIEVIKERFMNFSNVESVSSVNSFPTDVQSSTSLNMDRTGGNIYRLYTDHQFLDVFGVELLSGRFLDADLPTANERDFVINETAAKVLGWTAQSAIGQEYIHEDGERKNIIGVVKDFHIHSMHMPIAPLIIGKRDLLSYISVKVGKGSIPETVVHLQETVEEYSNYPFDYTFMDDHFDQIYKEDQRQGQLLGFFTLLAMLIAGLGLFGLAAFEAIKNQKEVGIRKVLGATIQSIVWLFGKKFLSLVTIGFVIAVPVSWLLMDGWLQNFAYRITPGWWVFALGGTIAILIAFATISSQSIKAALVNPVESLKDE